MWTKVANVWRYTDSSFVVASLAYLTYPSAGATMVDMSQPFTWTTAPNAQAYYLYVGTSIGAKDLVDTREILATSFAMPNLPPGVAYARLWAKVAGVWRYVHRAVDQHGQVIDVYVSRRRDIGSARTFFTAALAVHGALLH